MSYTDALTQEQKTNIALIKDEALKSGITNPYAIAGMLAIVSKESSFVPKSENLNYSASRLQQVFGLSSARANEIANKPELIGNAVYGSKSGNSSTEGYKYRGRGFNQLTFKGNYDAYGKLIGEDLVSNPDKVNNPSTAAKVLIAYNKKGIESLKSLGKLASYNATNINDFKNLEDATLAFYHATAGTGKSVDYVKGLKSKDNLGGMTKALQRVQDLFNYVGTSLETVKKNPIKTILVLLALGLSIYILTKNLGKGKSKL
jgi:putative chitinase